MTLCYCYGLVTDWYPKHIEVQQEGSAITVTFNLAPPNLGIRSYFSLCYINGRKKYTDIIPVSNFLCCTFVSFSAFYLFLDISDHLGSLYKCNKH